jgi:hypothetical protein
MVVDQLIRLHWSGEDGDGFGVAHYINLSHEHDHEHPTVQ